MAHRTGGGGHGQSRPWSATVGQAGWSMGAAKHQEEASMTMSRWASAALAKCTLEIDSLAYRGLPATPPEGGAGPGVANDPASRPATSGGA
jgi:hypothetical protein